MNFIKLAKSSSLAAKITAIVLLVAGVAVALFAIQNSKDNSLIEESNQSSTQEQNNKEPYENNKSPQNYKSIESIEDENIRNHLKAQTTKKYQKVTTSYSNNELVTILEVEIENNKLNKFRAQKIANNKLLSELIGIDSVYYALDVKNNTWWQQKVDDESDVSDAQALQALKYIEEFSANRPGYDFTYLGEEDCSGEVCLKYEMKKTKDLPQGSTIFINKNGNLLKKLELALSPSSKITMNYSYDAVAIEPPANAEYLPADKSIFELNNKTPSAN